MDERQGKHTRNKLWYLEIMSRAEDLHANRRGGADSLNLQWLRTVFRHILILEDDAAISHEDGLKVAVCGRTPEDGYFVLHNHAVEDGNTWVTRTDDLVIHSLACFRAGDVAAQTYKRFSATSFPVDKLRDCACQRDNTHVTASCGSSIELGIMSHGFRSVQKGAMTPSVDIVPSAALSSPWHDKSPYVHGTYPQSPHIGIGMCCHTHIDRNGSQMTAARTGSDEP